jgi:putative acetyltransferase
MSAAIIRRAGGGDRDAIRAVEERAFGQPDEALLVDRLVGDGDAVLELVAVADDAVVGHVLFSRLAVVDGDGASFPAVALAPVAVDPAHQGKGVGAALIRQGHALLEASGESLSVVLGEPAYYARFGYERSRSEAFECDYQGPYLQALAWRDAPVTGRLVYAPAFGTP